MLDSNTILDINKNIGEHKYRHGILTQNWEGWPCGVPIVYPDMDVDDSRNPIKTACIFTPSQGAAGLERYQTYSCMIKPSNVRPLYANHKVITVSEFDPGKFERLTEFVHDVGAISFVIDYKEGRKNIGKGIHTIESMVKYSSLFLHHRISIPILNGPDDVYACVMTFIDLPYCVPLFNMRKVDGMGLTLTGTTMKYAEATGILNKTFRTDILLSNFKDNVFVLDGVSVNNVSPIGNQMFHEIEKMTNLELKATAKEKKIKKLSLKKHSKPQMKEKYGYVNNSFELSLPDGEALEVAFSTPEQSNLDYPPESKGVVVQDPISFDDEPDQTPTSINNFTTKIGSWNSSVSQ